MPPFPKPAFDDDYEVDAQINALRTYEQTKPGRAIPPKQSDRVLPATWNIANLGIHERRRNKDYRLLAEILGWFDLIALQEVNDLGRGETIRLARRSELSRLLEAARCSWQ
jgi:hypothetical protein